METEQRLKRINELKSILYRVHLKDDTADYNKLVFELMNRWGASKSLIEEYITHLENGNVVRIDVLPLKGKNTKMIWMLNEYAEKMRKSEFDKTIYV